jgi:hypothetical protein
MQLFRNIKSINFSLIDNEGSLVPVSFTLDAVVTNQGEVASIITATNSLENKVFLVDGYSKYEKSKAKKANFLVKTNKITLDYPIVEFVNIKVNQFTIDELTIELERLINERTGLQSKIKVHENILLASNSVAKFQTCYVSKDGIKSICGAIELFAEINSQERFDSIQLLVQKMADSITRTYINNVTYLMTSDLNEQLDVELTDEVLFEKVLANFKTNLETLSIKTVTFMTTSSAGLIKLL